VADVLRYETLAVLDNGHIVLCWQRDVSLGANDNSIWALKGSTKFTVLSQESQGRRYKGSCEPWRRFALPALPVLDESFFDGQKVSLVGRAWIPDSL
jgi:hypothetical protein